VLLHTILEDLDLLILNRLYFSQGGPGLVPQPAAYGFQPQLFSGMRPGVSPNFMMPYPLQLQGQHGCQESWDPTAADSATSIIVVFFHL
ncbi:hypothetical protein MKX03_012664, partial [Papaver bracteatum]